MNVAGQQWKPNTEIIGAFRNSSIEYIMMIDTVEAHPLLQFFFKKNQNSRSSIEIECRKIE